MSNALPALHAVSGCDSTSAFFAAGKQIKAYKIVKNSGDFRKYWQGWKKLLIFTKIFLLPFKIWMLNSMMLNLVQVLMTRVIDSSAPRTRSQNHINVRQDRMTCFYT